MEVTPERIDAARDAARRCLTRAQVTALELSHLWPEAEAGGDWRRFSADAAGVFAAMRRDAEAAETALDAEALDCIKLAAGILPGYPVAGGVASTAHEAALQAGNAVYAALWAGGATGGPVDADILNGPPDFRTRQELWMQKLLTDLPDARQRRYWAAVIEAVGQVDIPRDLAAGIEREWAAARRAIAADALAAGAQPQGQPGAGDGQDAAPAGGAHSVGHCVRLSQAAAMVNRHKRTLAGWQANDEDFPLPVVEGGGGKPAEWEWTALRPYLERKAGKSLPEYHPSDPNRPDFGDATFWETEATDENR